MSHQGSAQWIKPGRSRPRPGKGHSLVRSRFNSIGPNPPMMSRGRKSSAGSILFLRNIWVDGFIRPSPSRITRSANAWRSEWGQTTATGQGCSTSLTAVRAIAPTKGVPIAKKLCSMNVAKRRAPTQLICSRKASTTSRCEGPVHRINSDITARETCTRLSRQIPNKANSGR